MLVPPSSPAVSRRAEARAIVAQAWPVLVAQLASMGMMVIDTLLLGKKQVDASTLEELEEILITADMGVATTVELIRVLEQRLKRDELKDAEALRVAFVSFDVRHLRRTQPLACGVCVFAGALEPVLDRILATVAERRIPEIVSQRCRMDDCAEVGMVKTHRAKPMPCAHLGPDSRAE